MHREPEIDNGYFVSSQLTYLARREFFKKRMDAFMTVQPSPLPALSVKALQGTELFRQQGVALDHAVGDFWRWAYSNLAANNLRGHLAEFLVGSDLGVTAQPRVEWANYDLLTKTGIKVEVKSAAYLQSWNQSRCSPISFGVAPTRLFNSVTGKRDG